MSDTARSPVGPLRAQRVICTLGMHRSGTSVVSRMLNLLGVYLGTHQSISDTGDHADNPKGYWEHRPLALLNDEILARFGGRWDEPPAFPLSWPRDPRLGDLREKARQLLTEAFGAEPVWGWKDPRFTEPYYERALATLRDLGARQERLDWLAARLPLDNGSIADVRQTKGTVLC
jgi:hypothetical protein